MQVAFFLDLFAPVTARLSATCAGFVQPSSVALDEAPPRSAGAVPIGSAAAKRRRGATTEAPPRSAGAVPIGSAAAKRRRGATMDRRAPQPSEPRWRSYAAASSKLVELLGVARA